MGRFHVVSFIGSSQRPSKTRQLAAVIAELTMSDSHLATASTFDLQDMGPALGAFTRSGLGAAGEHVLRAIEGADALIVGAPVHKGSYPGLFKHVFDLLDPLALVGKPVALLATGGGPRHALVVEHQLRPLFGFFCALTMPTAVYACGDDFDAQGAMIPTLQHRMESAASELRAALSNRARLQAPELLQCDAKPQSGQPTDAAAAHA